MELSDAVVAHLREVADRPDLTGTRYDLEREIGRGGMGVVYAACDRELDRRVALKVMDAALCGEPRLMARLEHPAIVPVYETGMLPDGRVFYAMKLVSGVRLDAFLESDASLAERLRVIQRVGEALAFAHSRGVLHRDLKPQNVMTGTFGEVYVMDWGVEAVAGTPAFRAPEGACDTRSDIYSLGALLQVAVDRLKPVPQLRAIAAKAMTPNPAARYPDATSLLAEIERFQNGFAVEAYPESPWETGLRYARRSAVLLWLLAAFVTVKFFLFFLRSR
ncbi:MAG TPA: serine/threonine-protein kinase [Candidatus Acidoferrales bacterium]|nr:serine/threonine-protein kinase [Candidatus Acidoferrales bacterium]